MSWLPRCAAHLARHRLTEVAVLQGSPALGMALAMTAMDLESLPQAVLLLSGSVLLVAHVFAFNDWADAGLDSAAPEKTSASFLLRNITRRQMLLFSLLLGCLGLALLATLPLTVLLLGAGVLASGLLYSVPGFGLKRTPVLSSLIHIAGQGMHFLMGYALFAPLDDRAPRLAAFFALVFAAGHLNQEVRDHDGDRAGGIRTNAVLFGRHAAFIASGALFAAAFVWLGRLAWGGDLPRPAVWLALLLVVYAVAFGRALAAGITFEGVTRLQRVYRSVFAIIGVALIAMQAAFVWAPMAGRPPADDPFGMAARCSWYDPDKLNVQWTFYMVTPERELIYVGFAPRLHDEEGRPFAGVNLVVLRDNRKLVDIWNRFPPEAAVIEDIDLAARIGPNSVDRRGVDDQAEYSVRLDLDDQGRRVTLDAELKRTISPCRPGGFELLSRKELGNHFEYEVPVLRAVLRGTLAIGEHERRLAGTGYLESIRWLRSPMARESRWFWGYLHADPYSVLFFDPEDYPGARGLMLLAEGNECPIVVENRGLQVTPPRAGTGEVVVRYHDEDTALSLSIDSAVPRSGGFPIFIAPYRLELERSGDRHIAAGSMVFEIGQWSTF